MSKSHLKPLKNIPVTLLVCILVTGCAVKETQFSPTVDDNTSNGNINETEEVTESISSEETAIVISPEIPASPTVDPTSFSTIEPIATESIPSTLEVIAGGEMQDMIAKVKAALASRLGVSPDEIIVVSVEAVTWNDSSLGCPSSGVSYLQVLTPGYKIILRVDGVEYAYHTDDANKYLLCNNLSL